MSIKMRHLVVFVPGIMGSALQKDGNDLWALSGQALWQFVRTWGTALKQLQVVDDDWQRDNLGDGIRAVRLIEDLYSIPGLAEHAGYSVFVNRIATLLGLKDGRPGSIDEPRAGVNFYSFPYDWRRDNRASALKLKKFIDSQLPLWRDTSGADDAKVILIGHSMGGLVSRYYLEALGGWSDSRALITIGTPHRGALGAVDGLSNGFRYLDTLSHLVRSFTSAYQLLPTYPALEINNSYVRVVEAESIPNIDLARAKQAREEFHEVIWAAAEQHGSDESHQTYPWVGTRQDTHQSAILQDGKLVLRYSPPAGLDASLADGDGTVPRLSAVPPDLDGKGFERYAVERHGWLTNNAMTLQPLLDTLTRMAAPGTRNLRGEPEAKRPSITLRLEPVYTSDEPVVVNVKLVDADEQPQRINVTAEPAGHQADGTTQRFHIGPGDGQAVVFEGLAPGLYQLTVEPQQVSPRAPAPVHGAFEVIEPTTAE